MRYGKSVKAYADNVICYCYYKIMNDYAKDGVRKLEIIIEIRFST